MMDNKSSKHPRPLRPARNVVTDLQSTAPYYGGSVYRVVWGAFGVFLVGLGACVLLFGVVDLAIRIGAGLLITLLGGNAVWSSVQSKPSWVARLFLFI